ncbi:MAG: EF2563 family selenium-dependent molybdenum hydroxylase system protein [Candidatus Marinimicrobia bacterium]|jgi:xanthine dehydrogenase accessory factor|nr:EF2563 family selenium-dependent molybdenum hydroxylase system protein [Candidatus Neomarinimicrobiota bacterium]MBT3633758.1 EF2563 family selenium-dependent molybdenum hydroxylase system protein [Candidatus Neomarinimicrobiota bacterium]MBT3682550.1 EF2563 family selenium-dependent molybdenum hydroxylase system protein [Candidatus Neomarinimicrobiota bacterium]MBT3759314.1 EF2563 family selenium-dependent molybdenum hydroxylase system protein [Candidatus Neomarinimicrobiota bacterium]MBT38
MQKTDTILSKEDFFILVRGAGELGSAAANSLYKCGFNIVLTDLQNPMAIRRNVSYCTAVHEKTITIEGVTARYCKSEDISDVLSNGEIPLFVDDESIIENIQPSIIIDARMLKKELEGNMTTLPFVIGLGPGFNAGKNCHLVIETNRGHNLGRIISNGMTAADTGIPGNIAGESANRVIRAPKDGVVNWQVDLGEIVTKNQLMGTINNNTEIRATLNGLVRGLIMNGHHVSENMKIADIDPRGLSVDYQAISDKARSIGRAVLEAVLIINKNIVNK